MKVLICGSYAAFNLRIIQRLRKERHEIFVITGNHTQEDKKVLDVFQSYSFSFTSNAVVNIIKNVAPDVIIFLGAMDEGYTWEDEKKQAVEFISGLTNVIIAAKTANASRFIFCSSLFIFENNTENEIKEDTKPRPLSYQMKTYAQGEDLCRYYHEPESFQVIILRFPEVYGFFGGKDCGNNICSEMIENAIDYQTISVIENKSHMLLSIDDAAEIVEKSASKKALLEQVYHAAGTFYAQNEIAEMIKKAAEPVNVSIAVIESKEEAPELKKYSMLHAEELGFRERHTLSTEVIKVYKGMKKNGSKKKKTENGRNQKFGAVILPFIENIVLFLLIYQVVHFTQEKQIGQNIDFYLLYVVIIGSIYGSLQALIAVILSTIGHFAGQIKLMGITFLLVDYSAYFWTLQILIIGVLTAFVRDKYVRRAEDYKDENEYLQEELNNIKKINESNVYIKNVYEKRLLNSKNSLAKVYEITSQLDLLEPRKVVFQAVEVVRQIMEAEDVTIYTASGKSKYFRLTASSSHRAIVMGKSICFDERLDLYEELQHKNIFHNYAMKEGIPTFAGAAYEEGRPIAIIMVWTNKLEQATLYQANLLAVLCRLIEKSMQKAFLYMESIYSSSYIGDSRIMNADAFAEILETYQDGYNQGVLEYALFRIAGGSRLPEEQKETVQRLVRDTDFIGMGRDDALYILLTNSTGKDTMFVEERFQKNGLTLEILECKERDAY